jgi:hypothetical protein
MESTDGQMGASTRVNGNTTKSTVRESTTGLTAESTLATTSTTRSTVREPSYGQMEQSMSVNGRLGSNMGRVCYRTPMAHSEMGSGVTVSGSS